jgi:hypothetical protein
LSRLTNADRPTARITEGQVEAFARSLITQGIIDKSDLEVNKDLLAETLKLSQSPEGLPMVMYSYSPHENTDLARPKPGVDPYNGQTITKPIHDPLEIFLWLYNSRKNRLADEQRAHKELVDKAEYDWYCYNNSTPASERYNVSLGGNITREYFLDNLYRCQTSARCLKRFKTQEEQAKHRWTHG